MGKIELLSPAGCFSKLKTAFYFGADAVYVGGKDFSLRAFATNFSNDELKDAVIYAHSLNKKLFVTLNVFARDEDVERVKDYLKYLYEIGVDAVIMTDTGLISMARKVVPNLEIHLSTQANTLNSYTINFWADQGVKRVVLARELSIDQISKIRDKISPETELEVFVHGAMCISYSGRCLLSNYLTNRDSNKGQCVQACRWEYEIREKSRDGSYLTITEDDRGTYILNSKDLNMLKYIDLLKKAGVNSFKVEGRMKSEYYLATVINAYRRGIDYLESLENGEKFILPSYLEEELKKTAHREYTTAFYLGENDRTVNYDDSSAKGDCEYIANVLSCDDGYITVEMRNRFKKGDVLEVLTPTSNLNKEIVVDEIISSKGEIIKDAKLVQEILKIKSDIVLQNGDILRRKTKS